MRALRTLALASFFAACVPAMAAMSIEDLSPGKTVAGPNLTAKDMKGKVTLVMYWGTR